MEGYDKLPLISFVIPTYNAEKHLSLCLKSIHRQSYPEEKKEIIVVDGGSLDKTLDIAKSFSVKIVNNPYRIAEFAKSIGIREAEGKYLVIVDSDNEIVQEDWLIRNILPLENDSTLVGMDSVFLVKKDDFLVNRYCALLGLEDPLVRYVADLSNNSDIEEYPGYSIYRIKSGRFPIFGSNGFIWRKTVFEQTSGFVPRYDEADFSIKVIDKGFNKIGFVKDVGIYHHHLETIGQFIGKRFRRGKEFLSRKFMTEDSKKIESGVWLDRYSKWELLRSVLLCSSFIYPLYESIRGYIEDRDIAWALHSLFCFVSVLIYGIVFLKFVVFRWIKISLILIRKRSLK